MKRRDYSQQRRHRTARQPLPELPPLRRPEHKPLPEMSTPEMLSWLLNQQAELEDFCSYAQTWRLSRNQRGIHTEVDDRYDQFLPAGLDLALGLTEWHKQLATAEKQVHLQLTAHQAMPLLNLIILRLEFLGAQAPNAQHQREYQTLQSVVLQLRAGAETQVKKEQS